MKYNLLMYKDKVFTEDVDAIFFYSHRGSKKGLTKACFSQFYPSKFEEDGIVFSSSELYMHYKKAVLFEGESSETAKKMLASTDPKEIKELGRLVKNFDPKIWNEHKFDIVTQGNVLKFSQNEELKQFLLNTGDKVLVEASPYDRIWGIGLRSHECDVCKWKGTNLLGFALMATRDILRNSINGVML